MLGIQTSAESRHGTDGASWTYELWHGSLCGNSTKSLSMVCADWLYNEPEVPEYFADYERAKKSGRTRMYGTAVTRKWMEQLGVTEHYVTKDGTQRIVL